MSEEDKVKTLIQRFRCPALYKSTAEKEAINLLSQFPNPADIKRLRVTSERNRLASHDHSTLLHYACRNKWYEGVRVLITKYKCEPDAKDKNGQTPLHLACESGDLKIVQYLISEHHCDPSKGENGPTPLCNACARGHLDIVKYLVSECNCDPLKTNERGDTPLSLACWRRDSHNILLSLLLTSGKLDKISDEKLCCTLLHHACRNKWYEGVRLLTTKYKCEPDAKDEYGWTPLHWACGNGDMRIAKYLISEHHCDPESKTRVGRTPLRDACSNGHLDIVKYLVTECNCDPESKDRDGWTPLHGACSNGHLDVVKYLVIECNCDPLKTDEDGDTALSVACRRSHNVLSFLLTSGKLDKISDEKLCCTLLHYACDNNWYEGVRLLITKYKCEPDTKDKNGQTPLHLACKSGDVRIVHFLINEHHCDPDSTDKNGWTTLDLACSNGHLEVVKYLVTKCSCDPLKADVFQGDTPLYLACSRGHYSVILFLLTSGKLSLSDDKLTLDKTLWSLIRYRRSHPFHPAFKVFVVGNQLAGKSTLVKALENKLTDTSFLGFVTSYFKKVSGVELRTAGIIPTHVHSPQLGHIILYDFAGQYEYYSSHAAYLENLVSSPGVLFLLVVDISKDTEEIVRTLQYWNSFIANLCNRCDRVPQIIVVGSHADVVKSQPLEKLSIAFDKLDSSLASSLKKSKVVINCTQAGSSSLSSIISTIATSSQTFHKECEVDMQVHLLNGVIENVSGLAVSFKEVSQFLSSGENQTLCLNLLASDDTTLSKHLTTLSEHGQLLYLRNDDSIHDSWVILNKELLLSQVNGTIFAPEYFKQHHDISSSTGVVPLSEIKKTFPDRDPQMIVGFLTYLEFCHQIGESEALLISRDHLKSSETQSESYYFFPALVSEERPEESCKSIVQACHKSGWCLQRIQEDQFFTSRFLHVLLLQLAFRFALAHNSTKQDKSCPVIQRKCNVWKSGIHWLTMDGVEAVVEVVEQNTAVTVVVGCQEEEEMASVQLRSDLIRTVLEMKEKYSGAVEVRESVISPSELKIYPLKNPKNLCLFDMDSIALTISEESKFVIRKQGFKQQKIHTSDLLYFEPFSSLSVDILKELFEESNDKKELDPRFLNKLGEAMQEQVNELQQTLQVKAKALRDAIHSSPPSVRDDPAHHCYLVLKIWKEQGHRSYGDLRSALSKFSVFCGRNPLVLAGLKNVEQPCRPDGHTKTTLPSIALRCHDVLQLEQQSENDSDEENDTSDEETASLPQKYCASSFLNSDGERSKPSIIGDKDWADICLYLKKLDPHQIKLLGGVLGLSIFNLQHMHTLPDDMVTAWLRREDDVIESSGEQLSWNVLVRALRDIAQQGLADEIYKDKCSKATT